MRLSKLRYGRPLWLDRSSPRSRRYPRQRGTLEVDVVIVGGGITGAIAAYLFSDAGIRVALVEAQTLGHGSTAASTALLMQEPDKDFGELKARYGHVAARAIWKALAGATRGLASTIQRLKIDCDFRSCDSIYFTLERGKVRRLKKEFRARRAARLPGRWLSAAALYRVTGIRGQAAIATSGNGEVDPVKACMGFIKAAAALGAKVFESSPVGRITATGDGVTVRTSGGLIHARQLLVATGYATREFKPLAGRFRLRDTYVVTTRRLPATMRRKLLGKTTMLWDTDRPYHYFRWTNDGRLVVGGEDVNHGSTRDAPRRLAHGRARLLEYLARVYPSLAGEHAEYSWEGLFAETSDGLPYVGTHRRYPRHLFALGYGGNGMTASFLAAKLLLERYRKRPSPDESLFSFGRSRKV